MKHPAILLACFLLAASFCAAAPKDQPFTFSWNAVEGAGGYVIEVNDDAGKTVLSERVSPATHRRTVQLIPGRYSLRLTTLNRFLRPEKATAWIPVSIRAARAPIFVALQPPAAVTGRPQSFTLRAEELAADATLAVTTPSNQDARAQVRRVSPGEFAISLSAPAEPGGYSIVITNPPDLVTKVPDAFTLTFPVPVIERVSPDTVSAGAGAASIQLAGREFSPHAGVQLVPPAGTGGGRVPLAISSLRPESMALQLPGNLAPGSYSLELTNEPGESAVTASFSVTAPAVAPVGARAPLAVLTGIDPVLIRGNRTPTGITLKGSHFQPGAQVFLVSADQTRVALAVRDSSPGSITATIPAGIDPGTYDVSLVNEPDAAPLSLTGRPVTILPFLAPAPGGRRLLLSLSWLAAAPLGDWGTIYPFTTTGLDLRADVFLTPHSRVTTGSALDFALGVDVRFLSLGNGDSSAFLPSTFLNLTFSVDPSLTWSLPFLSVTARVGGGAAYSGLIGTSPTDGSRQLTSSVDLALISGLDVLFPITDAFKVGASGMYQRLFLIAQPMDLLGVSAFASLNF